MKMYSFKKKNLSDFGCFCKSNAWYSTARYLLLIYSRNQEGITLPDWVQVCIFIPLLVHCRSLEWKKTPVHK